MFIGLIGDTHITNRAPKRRLDNYFESQLNKLRQALTIFRKTGCKYAIQVGDFFDTTTVANKVKSEIISLLHEFSDIKLLVIAGQHDIVGHTMATYNNSPLAVLEAAKVITILNQKPFKISEEIDVYGASFNEDVPKVQDTSKINVLVTHRMVGNRQLYPGQELASPRVFLRQNKDYTLCLLGDYHYPYQDNWQGHKIVNTGAIVRKNLSDVKNALEPQVCVISFPDLEITVHKLQVSVVEEVFNLTEVQEKNNEALLSFIEELKKSDSVQVNWKSILTMVIEKENVSESVKKRLDSILEKVL
jgi:predicted phosphodiesterase